MLNFIIIQARETTLKCHDVFAQNFSGLNIASFQTRQICSADAPILNMTKEIDTLAISKHKHRKKGFLIVNYNSMAQS